MSPRLALGAAAVAAAAALAPAASAAPPPNDAWANAIVVNGVAGSETGTTVDATAEPGEGLPAGWSSVWYRWTAPTDGVVDLDAFGDNVGAMVAFLYREDPGSPFGLSRLPAGLDVTGRYEVARGSDYLVSVISKASSQQTAFTLSWTLYPRPANDDFANATSMTGASGTDAGTTLGATREPSEPAPAGADSGGSVWYSWVAPASGAARVVVTPKPTNQSTAQMITVYDGGELATLASLGTDGTGVIGVDVGSSGGHVDFTATAGRTYSVQVETNSGLVAGTPALDVDSMGPFTIAWSFPNGTTPTGPCLLLSDSSASVSGPASTPALPQLVLTGPETMTMTNCSDSDAGVDVHGTGAAGIAGTWRLSDERSFSVCDLGPNVFRAALVLPQPNGSRTDTRVSTTDIRVVAAADNSLLVLPPGAHRDFELELELPCNDSIGLGEEMNTSVVLTAVEP
jgi:hypothetical protein